MEIRLDRSPSATKGLWRYQPLILRWDLNVTSAAVSALDKDRMDPFEQDSISHGLHKDDTRPVEAREAIEACKIPT